MQFKAELTIKNIKAIKIFLKRKYISQKARNKGRK